MIKKVCNCEICGVSSELKRVNFIKDCNMYLCRKHREQFLKYGEFKDTNSRGVFDPNEIRILENYAEVDTYDAYGNIIITYKIDLEDVEKLNGLKWRTVFKNEKPYLFTGNQKSDKIYFHRLIMGNPEQQIDHISGDTSDNRKSNLRIVTLQNNMKNLKKKSTNTSGIRGVSYSSRDNNYKVDFTYEGKRYYSKGFCKKEEAVFLRYLYEKHFLKDFRNSSNDELYINYINNLTDLEKESIIQYFNNKINTSKDGVVTI